MKLQDFLIGIGLFGLFSVIIFGAINPEDTNSIYAEDYLNITHTDQTSELIANISATSSTIDEDFTSIRGDMNEFTSNRSTDEEPTDASLVKDSIRVLINLPKAYKPATNAIRSSSVHFGIPPQFTTWVISSIIIIVTLMLLASFLRNKLQS